MIVSCKCYNIINTVTNKEKLFAKFPDGKIKTCFRNFSWSFHHLDNQWEDSYMPIPPNANYIGDYQMLEE